MINLSAKAESVSLSDALPFWHFDRNFMVFSDGSLGAGFLLTGVDLTASPIESLNDLSRELESLLHTAEEGSRLQFFFRMTPHVSERLDEHERLSGNGADCYQDVAKARMRFFRENTEARRYSKAELYLFVRSAPFRYPRQGLWQKRDKFERIARGEYTRLREKFVRTVKQIESSAFHAGLKPEALDERRWFSLLYEYFNPGRSENHPCPVLRQPQGEPFLPALSEQLALSDLKVNERALDFGGKLVRTLTLKTLPEGRTQISMIEALLRLPIYFWLSQGIEIPIQKKELEKLELSRRLAHSMASGSAHVADLESESKFHSLEALIGELLSGSEKIVQTDLTVIIWGDTEEELEEKSDEVLKAFRGMGQSEAIQETLAGFDAFLGAAPGVCRGLRPKKVKASNAAHFMPVFADWSGNARPVCLLSNRGGGLFAIDPFAPELPNWNGIIFGGSGSGKSFCLLQLILQFYGSHPRPKVIWIDNGASSRRAVEVLGGEFIDLNIFSEMRINAFDLDLGEIRPSPSKVKLILAVLETILEDDERPGIPKRERALLEEAILRTYESVPTGTTPCLSDLRKLLSEHPSSEMRKFSEILFSWTGETAYGRLLDGPSKIRLTQDLTTIEIKGLDNTPELQNVLLLLFTDFIRKEAARDLTQPFVLIIDEGWKIFQTPAALSFALEAYRTFRKYNAGIWCISQNYRDFLFNEEISAAILPNTTSVFILKQRRIDWSDFKERLGLNETEVEAIKSLRVVKGDFTEMFYIQDEGRALLKVTPDPLSYWICTSDPVDKARIEQMRKDCPGLSQMELLKKLAYPEREAS